MTFKIQLLDYNHPITEESLIDKEWYIYLQESTTLLKSINDIIITGQTTVSSLSSSSVGARAFVSDSNVVASGNFGAIVSGGGTNNVPVYYDGTNWRIG
jgi:hypothetical protein